MLRRPTCPVPAVGLWFGAMVDRDGNGWTRCGQGHRHWGRFGAAGLLAWAPCSPDADPGGLDADPGGPVCVLLQRRSWWGNHGGTWGPPGGARDSHETDVAAALREAQEECGLAADAATVRGILRDDHGGWSYRTVIASAPGTLPVRAVSSETSQAAWVPVEDVDALALHPGFAARWPVLREALQPVTIIVDVANVMGSRPDGWWRDRAGAARRLRDQVAGLAAEGVAALPASAGGPGLERWFPDFLLVVEGAARSVAAAHGGGPAPAAGRVRVLAARGSGDDTIAEQARDLAGRRLVVTADRQLRERCVAAGAAVTGPSWLLAML